jgi:TonB family protein
LISLLIGAVKLSVGLRRTSELVKGSSPLVLDSSAKDILSRSALSLGIPPVDVYCNARLLSPATVSWPKPMLIVPAAFKGASDEEAATVIAHELAHISRKDFEVNLVFEALALFVYYHPASRWIKRQIVETRETVCDELAADCTDGRRAYARSLLTIAQSALRKPQTANLSLGILETTNLEKRIMKLVDARLPLSRKRRLLLTTCCWTALATCSAGLVLFSLHPSTVQAAHAPTFLYDPTETPDVLVPAASRKAANNPHVNLLTSLPASEQTQAHQGVEIIEKQAKDSWEKVMPSGMSPASPDAISTGRSQAFVTIEFSVAPDGQVSAMLLFHPSGRVELDRAAWSAVTGLNPRSAFPAALRADKLRCRATFTYDTR